MGDSGAEDVNSFAQNLFERLYDFPCIIRPAMYHGQQDAVYLKSGINLTADSGNGAQQ